MRGPSDVATVVALLLAGALHARAEAPVAIADHLPEAALEIASEGDASARRPLRMTAYLAPRNAKKLERLIDTQQDPASPRYRRWLSAEEYERRFGPTEQDVDEV